MANGICSNTSCVWWFVSFVIGSARASSEHKLQLLLQKRYCTN